MLCTCFCHSLICRSSRHVKWVVSGHCCHSILALLVSITECEQVTHLPGFKTSSGRCDQNIRARTPTYRIPQVALWRHESWICFNSSRWILHHAFFLVKLSVWFFLYCTVFENHRKSRIQYCERSELRLHFEWTKVHTKCQKSSISAWNLRSNIVSRQVTFKRTKLVGKYQKWKIQM